MHFNDLEFAEEVERYLPEYGYSSSFAWKAMSNWIRKRLSQTETQTMMELSSVHEELYTEYRFCPYKTMRRNNNDYLNSLIYTTWVYLNGRTGDH